MVSEKSYNRHRGNILKTIYHSSFSSSSMVLCKDNPICRY